MKTLIYNNQNYTARQFQEIIKEKFQNHIGVENGISTNELINKFFPDFESWNFYKQFAHVALVQRLIGQIRHSGEMFIMSMNGKLFIMKTKYESKHFKDGLRCRITGMQKSMIKADNWVKNKKWLDMN